MVAGGMILMLRDFALMAKSGMTTGVATSIDDPIAKGGMVGGLLPERELAFVRDIAKTSLRTKLLVSTAVFTVLTCAPHLLPFVVVPGGAYLSYEAAEAVLHAFGHGKGGEGNAQGRPSVDCATYEKEKKASVNRNDLAMSTEVMTLIGNALPAAGPAAMKLGVLGGMAVALTFGVFYPLAKLIKADDNALEMKREGMAENNPAKIAQAQRKMERLGRVLDVLPNVGTAVMFVIGGGCLLHMMPGVGHVIEHAASHLGSVGGWVASEVMEGLVGVAGGLAVIGAKAAATPVVRFAAQKLGPLVGPPLKSLRQKILKPAAQAVGSFLAPALAAARKYAGRPVDKVLAAVVNRMLPKDKTYCTLPVLPPAPVASAPPAPQVSLKERMAAVAPPPSTPPPPANGNTPSVKGRKLG